MPSFALLVGTKLRSKEWKKLVKYSIRIRSYKTFFGLTDAKFLYNLSELLEDLRRYWF